MVDRRWWPPRGWRAPIPSSSRRCPGTTPGCAGYFGSSRFPAGFPSTPCRRHRARSMRAVSWGTPLAHTYGAALDNPGLLVACVIGDGEAETGALAASWHANKFLDPVTDGTVLPILHLNGYKIANPT